jgi:hypothetical protein
VFNLVWGTIIGLAISVAVKLLMGGSLVGMTVAGIGGSLALGCSIGFWDPSVGIMASYFGAVLSLVIYSVIKIQREL